MRRMPLIVLLVGVTLGTSTLLAQSPKSARAVVQGFFDAFNSGDPAQVQEFYKTGATEAFRARRTEEEDRALYERLFGDLGQVEVKEMRRLGDRAQATVRSANMADAIVFTFDIVDGLIGGLSVEIGEPAGGDAELVVVLPDGADDEELTGALHDQLTQLAAEDEFSGVVLLARGDRPVFLRGYGQSNRASGARNTETTRFDVGSITKLLTKIAVAQLLQAGKLKEEQTLVEVLPDYPNREVAARITIGQLLQHRAGLGDIFNERWESIPKEKLISPRDFYPLFVDQPLRYEPGEGKAYSNAGYVVLGAVVEAVSGEPYADYLARHVFKPAGMKSSGFPVRDGTDPEIAIGYTRDGEKPELQSNLGMLPIRGCPAGSSTHTAEDLLKLDRALRGGKLLDAGWTAWVYTGARSPRKTADYTLGIAGGGPGVNADLETDGAATAIVLTNLDPPEASRLARQLYRALAGKGS